MAETHRLKDYFQVATRFTRSVHLERDFYSGNQDIIGGYVLTVTARKMLDRILRSLESEDVSRAWSLTGPYGSGKSSFALFLSKLLGSKSERVTKKARQILKQEDSALWERLQQLAGGKGFNFCPVLITGSRSSITSSILSGLSAAIKWFYSETPIPAPLYAAIQGLEQKNNKDGWHPRSGEITSLFSLAAEHLDEHSEARLILVVDELGKFLEFSAIHPDQTDIFVLQDLAVLAERSRGRPFLLFTVLHQSIARYAQHLSESQTQEWDKIQGRFEDIPFIEPTEQVVQLIGGAIDQTKSVIPGLEKNWQVLEQELIKLDVGLSRSNNKQLLPLLAKCLPLHPTVSLALGALFRQIAQNERSVFAFLGAGEPHSFIDFIQRTSVNGQYFPLLTLSHLYDYVTHALGGRLYSTLQGKRWAEIEAAIQRQKDPSEMSVRLIKTIGLLGILGEPVTNLRASKELLCYALNGVIDAKAVETNDQELRKLENSSIIVFRNYNKAYAIWEGSDINIEAAIRESEAEVSSNLRLKEVISDIAVPRPLVAHRHSFVTGTMRFFAVKYTDLEDIQPDLSQQLVESDGLILYVLPQSQFEREKIEEIISDSVNIEYTRVVVALPKSIAQLKELVVKMTRLEWVKNNTPELSNDATARRELSAISTSTRRDLDDQLASVFGSDFSFATGTSCDWFYRGEKLAIKSRRDLNSQLSDICEGIFPKTPILRNELINRSEISSQATAARKKLIHAMITRGEQEGLVIEGYPPEKSIYLSMLLETKIHKYSNGKWGFYPPSSSGSHKMSAVWLSIDEFFSTCRQQKRRVSELYQLLHGPPIGLRSGPIPIILCAALLYYQRQIGLYENGSFIPDPTTEVFERLIRSPQTFEVKDFRLVGIQTEVFEGFLSLLEQNQQSKSEQADILTIVKPLLRFVGQLPKYTTNTTELSEHTVKLRNAILNSQEADHLIFSAVPEFLGFDAFSNERENEKRMLILSL